MKSLILIGWEHPAALAKVRLDPQKRREYGRISSCRTEFTAAVLFCLLCLIEGVLLSTLQSLSLIVRQFPAFATDLGSHSVSCFRVHGATTNSHLDGLRDNNAVGHITTTVGPRYVRI